MIEVQKFFRVAILALVLAGLGGGLSACNTVEGVGKDVKSAGDKLDESAQKNNTYKERTY